ncbi:glycosyltransferase [Microbacterium sp. H1-D42]|uniref:glycosyltransferase n=1 Tax=Microbacterium sp. H1-D42 TaxID=2925844 RepID=UPI001F52BCAB|nr:glycosyltransferase [Microbacterium sp. H1-D42]UNK70108.1 glycosyltransferase [Microbacterium sp. H1-D42]
MAGLLVHEWIETSGGAEHVLEAMARAFPDADIQCLWNDAPQRFTDRRVRETWLARTPLRRHKALALPFTVPTWRSLRDADDAEWMLISSHLFAHHARLRRRDVPKYVYAHTPARYIWDPELDERGSSAAVRAVAPAFRRVDRARAQEATAIAANSGFVRDRIRRAWDRDATVIHPPVAVDRILSKADWRDAVTDDERRVLNDLPDEYVLGASRFIPYKRLDLVILAAERAGLPAVIAGSGPDEDRLRALASEAGVPVTFVIFPSDALMYALMQRASAFVFPAVEDFGIVPVEAQAAGTPVVTGPVGGQLETFEDGVSGVVASSTEPVDLASAITTAVALRAFDPAAATAGFSEQVFATKIRDFVRSGS